MTGEGLGPIAMHGNRFLRLEARQAKKLEWIPMLNKAIWAVHQGRHMMPQGAQDIRHVTSALVGDSHSYLWVFFLS